MVPAAKQPGKAYAPKRSSRSDGAQDQSRLLPVLAVERTLRAVLLVGVGLILLTHTHTDWTDWPGLHHARRNATGQSPSPTGYWRRWRATACYVTDHGASI